MIVKNVLNSRTNFKLNRTKRDCMINSLIESRNIFNVQTLAYDLMVVCSTDLDPTGNFLLIGLSNGSVDIQGIQDQNFGTLDSISRLNLSQSNLHRVQWNPGDEQFFSTLDNHTLCLVDPVEMRAVDRFSFNLKTTWSEWNHNDKKMIAVCGTESTVRLVDIRSGSSVQTIILGAKSGLASNKATRCLWSKQDLNCLIVGDNEGFLHLYDTRRTTRPMLLVGDELRGHISGMSFTNDHNSIITSHGTENHLIQWDYDKCCLRPSLNKFEKRKKEVPEVEILETTTSRESSGQQQAGMKRNLSKNSLEQSATSSKAKRAMISKSSMRKQLRRHIPAPFDVYLRCQFYVTDRHVYCPVPSGVTKSKVLYIYDLVSGYRIKTLKTDDVMWNGIYSVTGLLPDSLVLYVGGRARLSVWSLDEEYQLKLEEKIKKYHKTSWDSDDEI